MSHKTPEISLPSQPEASKYTNFTDLEALDSITDPKTQDALLQDSQSERYFGNNIVFAWRNKEPYFTLGPHWYLFLISWTVLELGGIFIYFKVSHTLSFKMKLLSIVLIIWQGFIFMLTGLKNPGIVTAEDPKDPELLKMATNKHFCLKCKIIKEKDTVHCYDCRVCIKGYDHHCPWTGKCIGAGNIYPFYAFLISTAGYICYFIMINIHTLNNL